MHSVSLPEVTPRIQSEARSPQLITDIPPLETGDHLTRAEFERRYKLHPEIKKAELIEGVVYVASPVHVPHGEPHLYIGGWVTYYLAATPGLRAVDNTSIILNQKNEYQPDISVWIDETFGGQARVGESQMLEGAPELAIEIAASSASIDLKTKKKVYQRHGVREYIVLLAHERAIRWFVLQQGEYQLLLADQDGILRSRHFPGLWFDEKSFWGRDLAQLFTVLQQGLATPEHAEFVTQLQARKQA
ncbi:MAG: Uma2 family endonuclease [Caldilineaceae bacterium]